jgi:hypothetical protein
MDRGKYVVHARPYPSEGISLFIAEIDMPGGELQRETYA